MLTRATTLFAQMKKQQTKLRDGGIGYVVWAPLVNVSTTTPHGYAQVCGVKLDERRLSKQLKIDFQSYFSRVIWPLSTHTTICNFKFLTVRNEMHPLRLSI